MKRDDWFGIGWSLAAHFVLVVAFSFMSVAASEKPPVGFMEVEFGPLTEASPSKVLPESRPTTPAPIEEKHPPVPRAQQTDAPEVETEVDLPDQPVPNPEDEVIPEPAETAISPEVKAEETVDTNPKAEKEDIVRPLGSGAIDEGESAEPVETGTGQENVATAPYQIEGLNRAPVDTPLPVYSAQVNAIIRIRITVGPSGRIIRRVPLLKGNPSLEKAVMDALLRWRFNPLPADAPQTTQTGSVTFRFRLR